jgi:hypothetical protein
MSILGTGHKINIDLGNYCNLSCPNCMRISMTKDYNKKYNKDVKDHPFLNKIHVTLSDAHQWFPIEFLQQRVNIIEMCGSLAEPTLNPQCIELVKYFAPHVDVVSISTNADTRNTDWWQELAQSASNLVVRFYLDSLKPNNSLYRQSNSNKIVEHLRAFTSAGGKALLSHVVFKHNQDEIDDFKSLAKEVNCNYRMFVAREFTTDDTFTSYEVEYNNSKYLLEKNTIIPSNLAYKSVLNSTNPNDYCSLTHEKIIRVFCNGLVFPCCHLEGQFFDVYEDFFMDENNTKPNLSIHPELTKDFISKIELQGGIKTLSLKYNTIENIMNSNFYRKTLQMSWKLKSNKTCLKCINGTRSDIKDGNEINNMNIPNIPKAG